MPLAPPRLDDQVCFALYTASRAMTAAYRPFLEKLDLTYPQYLVMMVLWEWDASWADGGMRVGQLGDRLGMDIGTLSPLLKRMETRGVLERRRSSEDERVVEVSLTAEGKRLGKNATKGRDAALCKANLSMQQMQELRTSLQTLTKQLNQIHDNPPTERDLSK